MVVKKLFTKKDIDAFVDAQEKSIEYFESFVGEGIDTREAERRIKRIEKAFEKLEKLY
jgi:hypothetical protein